MQKDESERQVRSLAECSDYVKALIALSDAAFDRVVSTTETITNAVLTAAELRKAKPEKVH
jgi:hypothetical protein